MSHRRVVSSMTHLHLAAVRRAVLAAARRGFREAAVSIPAAPADAEAVRAALNAEGFGLVAVAGEDGAYAVVHW